MYSEIFLPESMYRIDSSISRQDLSVGDVVTGKVIALKACERILKVDLGNGLIGFIPLFDSTIYSIYKDGGLFSPNIYKLVGRTIRAKIIYLGDNIILSRKYHMLEALSVLKKQAEFQNVSITSFSKVSAFVDIGAGITGKIYAREFSNTKFRNIRDIGLNEGDVFPVKNLGFEENFQTFNLSRTQILPKVEEVLSENDIVNCKVFEEVGDGIGYYVLINQSISGLLDSEVKLHYGENVIGVVKKITPKGPKLRFLTF